MMLFCENCGRPLLAEGAMGCLGMASQHSAAASETLHVVYVASVSFKPLRQFLVGLSDTAHLLLRFRVMEAIGSRQNFFSACSQFGD